MTSDPGAESTGEALPVPACGVELGQQCVALMIAETTQPAGGGDPQLDHDVQRCHVTDPRQRRQQLRHPQLGDDLVGGSLVEDVADGGLAAFELIFECGPGTPCRDSFIQRRQTLLSNELRKSHRNSPIPPFGVFTGRGTHRHVPPQPSACDCPEMAPQRHFLCAARGSSGTASPCFCRTPTLS
jgi:hypothetical protein